MRKTLINAMYLKISKLSQKSMTETNSGKLVTIVSGDIQSIERALGFVPAIFSSPFTNLVAYVILGYSAGWKYSLIAFLMWVIIMIGQHYSSRKTKDLKQKESRFNDER